MTSLSNLRGLLFRAALLLGPALGWATEQLAFKVKLETLAVSTEPAWQWFHPRPAAIPGRGLAGAPLAVITLQRHLNVSDYYSGLYAMTSGDLGKTWEGPIGIPELGWIKESDSVDVAVADVIDRVARTPRPDRRTPPRLRIRAVV